ncbi:MAG: sugar ABC transporter substrate-binding protein [Treponema sp.]|jgi:ABC-type sugar transport system substrate-binding protein|nr:sugar ABC transporter substrate-binding protein [Treponema sp.]
MRKRIFVFFACVFMVPAALFAGGKSESSGKDVTLILKNLTNPFFISVKEGAEAAAAEFGLNLTTIAPLKADNNEEQMQMVEQAIARRTDCLVIIPSDTNGIVPAVEKAYEAGIPIVDLNTKIGGDKIMWKTFVAIENYDGGFLATTKLCELMGGSGGFILIEGVPGAQTSIDRVNGSRDALAKFPGVRLLATQSANYNRATAMNVVQNLLHAYPDAKAIFCCNDEMALGAVEAVEAAGRQGILIGGVDANADARQAIKDGKMTLSIDSQPYVQGYEGVKAAAQILRGETLKENIVPPIALVTKDNS